MYWIDVYIDTKHVKYALELDLICIELKHFMLRLFKPLMH